MKNGVEALRLKLSDLGAKPGSVRVIRDILGFKPPNTQSLDQFATHEVAPPKPGCLFPGINLRNRDHRRLRESPAADRSQGSCC